MNKKCAENTVGKKTNAAESFSGERTQSDDITLLTLESIDLEQPETALFDTSSGTEGTARIIDGVDALLTKHGCSVEVRRSIDVVVDELCANITAYAYEGENGPMCVEAKAGSNFIILKFIDSGMEFDPLEHSDPELSDEPMPGGLGLYLVKNLVDEISYRRLDNKNVLTVTKFWNV